MNDTYQDRTDRPSSRRRRTIVLLSVAAVAAAVGGTAVGFASVPDSAGVIHACYQQAATDAGSGSPLLIVDSARGHCPGGYTAITWNQAGVRGPQGLPGRDGTGPAWISENEANGGSLGSLSATYLTVGRVSLPDAGPYEWTAQVSVENLSESAPSTVSCLVQDAISHYGEDQTITVPASVHGELPSRVYAHLSGAATLPTSGVGYSLTLRCADPGGTTQVHSFQVIVTRVSTLTTE